jgi:hypothetical protein
MGSDLLGVPLSTKTGWEVATWAVAHAFNYHLTSVTFEGRRWTAGSGTWGLGAAGVPANVVEVS